MSAEAKKELNGVMMQYFHWYLPADGRLWQQLARDAKHLAEVGVSSVWAPPAYKGIGGGEDVGYGVYDLYDLGEFDQKGSVRTKYGTKEEYVKAVAACRAEGIEVYADIVMNHRMGADREEECEATPYDMNDRTRTVGGKEKILAWTWFQFPGRSGKYSAMEWHWWHFDAVDYNGYKPDQKVVYLLKEKQFEDKVDDEKGNYDYLMGCDLDVSHEEVRRELKEWGKWYLAETGVDGFRFDAVKHVKSTFFSEWLKEMRRESGKRLFAVGEYWSDDVEALHGFIAETGGDVALFDAPLHYQFSKASKEGRAFDLSRIFEGTLVSQQPALAVTLVENHDSQPLQSLESVVESWFKPHAYALILLRQGGYPCLFYADYYGAEYEDFGRDGNEHEIVLMGHQLRLDQFLWARKEYAYGEQKDYFDHPNTVGWTRLGTETHEGGVAVVMTNGEAGSKWMDMGRVGEVYVDLTGEVAGEVVTNADGWGEFRCLAGSVSVWVRREGIEGCKTRGSMQGGGR